MEADYSIAKAWQRGETGKGKVIFYTGEPTSDDYYARFVRRQLLQLPMLDALVHAAPAVG